MHLISLVPNKRKRVVLIAVVAVGVAAALLYAFVFRPGPLASIIPESFPGLSLDTEPPLPKEPNVVNGLLVDAETANRRPLAIMIENHTAARPQVGLTKAAIVYEAIAEGGITRFMAVYSPFDADKVGPVRSARQYYVEWARGLDAFYAHVGGSQDARTLIRTLGVADLDQFRYGTQAYHREPKPGVAIEHTMFTSTKLLYEVARKAKFELTAVLTPYQFKEEAPGAERGTAQTATIDFSFPTYKVVWTYDPITNAYLRSQAGAAHVDRVTNEQISAKTIAIATVKRQLKAEEDGPGWIMTTTGSGKATVLLDGKSIVGTWKRPAKTDMIRFFNEAGEEIALNRGQTWIEIVPPDVSYSIQ